MTDIMLPIKIAKGLLWQKLGNWEEVYKWLLEERPEWDGNDAYSMVLFGRWKQVLEKVNEDKNSDSDGI